MVSVPHPVASTRTARPRDRERRRERARLEYVALLGELDRERERERERCGGTKRQKRAFEEIIRDLRLLREPHV